MFYSTFDIVELNYGSIESQKCFRPTPLKVSEASLMVLESPAEFTKVSFKNIGTRESPPDGMS